MRRPISESAALMLGMMLLWWALVLGGGPAVIRLPLTLAVTFLVPGAAMLGALRQHWSAVTTALMVGFSLAISTLVSLVLGLAGVLSARIAATVLLGVVAPPLLWQLARRPIRLSPNPSNA
jgi:hypothetical protein